MDLKQLMAIAPGISKPGVFLPLLNKYMPEYGINGKLRQSAFIAQILHETGSFRWLHEIASGKEYDTGRLAIKLGNTPQKDGDGEMYKGRGCIMITGRANYLKYGRLMGIDLIKFPNKLEEPENAVWSACIYWNEMNLNVYADKGDMKTVTKRINGGLNGYDDRMKFYKRAMEIL